MAQHEQAHADLISKAQTDADAIQAKAHAEALTIVTDAHAALESELTAVRDKIGEAHRELEVLTTQRNMARTDRDTAIAARLEAEAGLKAVQDHIQKLAGHA